MITFDDAGKLIIYIYIYIYIWCEDIVIAMGTYLFG